MSNCILLYHDDVITYPYHILYSGSADFCYSEELSPFRLSAQFFEGFQMEAEVFYFVSSCDSLTDGQITAAKQEFLSFLSSQNLCGTSGMIQCSISDVTLECGEVMFKRRKRSTNFHLKFKFTVAVPAMPRSELDCNDYCVRQSYCEERCADNYNAAAESELFTVSNVISEIFDRSNTDLPTAVTADYELETEDGSVVTFGGLLLVPDVVVVKNVSVFCDAGFMFSNDTCGKQHVLHAYGMEFVQ